MRADEDKPLTAKEYFEDVEEPWVDRVARLTEQAEDAFDRFLSQRQSVYIGRLNKAGTPPTRVLVDVFRSAERVKAIDPLKRVSEDLPTQFVNWVYENILNDDEQAVEEWADLLEDWGTTVATVAGTLAAEQLLDDLLNLPDSDNLEFDFDSQDTTLMRYLSERAFDQANLIKGTTDEGVIMTLWDVVADGKYTIDKAQDALQESYDFSETRARTIARTEILTAARTGQNAADAQSGLVIGKEWRSANQERTREAHKRANGQIVPFDQPFIVNRQELMFPGDASMGATADNVIQCRCWYKRILVGEEDKLP